MQIYRPVKSAYLTQGFGESRLCAKADFHGKVIRPFVLKPKSGGLCPVGYKSLYESAFGLAGHNGEDWRTYHGEPLYFPVYVEGMEWVAKNEVDNSGGVGVDIISKEPININGEMTHVKFRFWHLRNSTVADGETVKLGQLIGYCDNTGVSTGNHLHWSMKLCLSNGTTKNKSNGYLGAVDFRPWFVNSFVLDNMPREEIPQIDLSRFDEPQLTLLRQILFKAQMLLKELSRRLNELTKK